MENYLVSIAIKKLVQGLVKGAVTLMLSVKAVALEAKLGIHLDPVAFEAGSAAMILGMVELAHDWLKLRYPTLTWL